MGRYRRLFKAVYPYANTMFELWLLMWNIAYLFDKTSAYRPWLNWLDLDIRRLGVEDIVSVERVEFRSSFHRMNTAIRQSSCATEGASQISKLVDTSTAFNSKFPAASARLVATAPSDSYILCKVPGMVVLTWIACTVIITIPKRTCNPTSKHVASTPPRFTLRQEGVWVLSHMQEQHTQCDCSTLWLCVLLPLRVRASRKTRKVPNHSPSGSDLAT